MYHSIENSPYYTLLVISTHKSVVIKDLTTYLYAIYIVLKVIFIAFKRKTQCINNINLVLIFLFVVVGGRRIKNFTYCIMKELMTLFNPLNNIGTINKSIYYYVIM